MQTYTITAVTAPTNYPLAGASVSVYSTGTSTFASIYDLNGNPIANPMTADANGIAIFQVADGTYDIVAQSGSYVGPTHVKVQIYDLSNIAAEISALQSTQVVGTVGFSTLAALNADLNYPANTAAVVLADSTTSNNGSYLKSGASGSGSWSQVSTLSLAGLNAAMSLLAPLASPALTGNPTAPTQTAGDSSTKLATTAFVTGGIGTAVATETARAEAAEALLAPLASPALTGNPTAPTQTTGDNSTKIATTAFVDSSVAVGTATTKSLLLTDARVFNDPRPEYFPDRHFPRYGYDSTSGWGVSIHNDVLYVFAIMGQSNAAGAVDTAALVTSAPLAGYFGRALMPSPWVRVAIPSQMSTLVPLYEAYAGSVGETMASGLVYSLLEALDAKVSGVKPSIAAFVSAIGGQALYQLKRGSPAYTQAISTVADITTYARSQGVRVVVHAVWMQGEQDKYVSQETTYISGLRQLRRQFGEDCRAITGQTEDLVMFIPQIASVSQYDQFQQVQSAQRKAAKMDQFICLAGPTYPYPASTVSGQYPHHTNIGQNMMGQMVARAVGPEIFGPGWAACAPIDVYMVSSTVIRVSCDAPVAPLVIDTTGAVNPSGLPTGNYLGFDVQDTTGSYLTIWGLAVTTPNSWVTGTAIDITLSSAPANFPLLVSYACRRNGPEASTFDGPITGARGCIHDSAADVNVFGLGTDHNWLIQFQEFVYA